MEFVCRGDWLWCGGGDGGRSRVMYHGCKSVLHDKRMRDDVCDAAGANGSTIGAVARNARRDGARQRRKLELPFAVHTRVVESDNVLENERTFSLGYLRATLNIGLGNKTRLVARVKDLERRI